MSKPMQLDLDQVIRTKSPGLYRKIPRFVVNHLKRKIHENELNEILRIYADRDGVDFAEACVSYFQLNLEVDGLAELPDTGRFIFAANHPLGGMDGICLATIIGRKYRGNIRYLVNDLLLSIKNLQSIFVPINMSGAQSKEATRAISNAYLSDNQVLYFPSGLCSRKINGQIADLPWKKSFIQKAVETQRDVIPVYFDGQNSNFFYRFANIRKFLGVKFNVESVLLSDEMFKNRGKTFRIIFGEPISYAKFDDSKSPLQWAAYVRNIVYGMSTRK